MPAADTSIPFRPAPKRLRVLYVSEIPTPYRRPFLRRLAADPALDLTVAYLSATQGDRAWRMEEPPDPFERVLKGLHWCASPAKGYYNRFNPGLFPLLSPRRFDVAVFGAYYVLSMLLGMRWCRWRGLPYVLLCESHSRRARSGARVWIKERAVGPLIAGAAAWLPLGTLARDYLIGYGADPARSFFCPNTPDVEAMTRIADTLPDSSELRARYGLPAGKPLFLYVGRFVALKRIDLLLDAYVALRAGGAEAALALAGSGREEDALRQRVAERRIPGVHFLGFRQAPELPALYRMADAFVLPSDDEPWGVVVNESLACGTPVIASDAVGAAADLVGEGETGFVFPAGDARSLLEALRRVAASPGLRDRLAPSCRARAAAWGYGLCHQSLRAAVEIAAERGKAQP